FFYYHPIEHRLVMLSADEGLDRDIYHPLINRPIFDAAAFALFFIAQLSAIVPMYGTLSRDFCLLEAGSMLQLLMLTASACNIGVCPIGSLDFLHIRRHFVLDESHILVHSLIGGGVDKDLAIDWSP